MEELTGNGVKDISVDDGVNSVYKDVKLRNAPYLVTECFADKNDEFGSVKSSLASKPSSERTDYSLGSSFEKIRNTMDAFNETGYIEAIAKRTNEKPYIPPLKGDSENVKLVSLARLLQEEREIYGFDEKQESQTQELIPLEEFNRRYCSLHSSDSINKDAEQKISDINECLHPPSTVDESRQSPRVRDAFGQSSIGLERADQGALVEPNPSASNVNNEFLKRGIKADSTGSLSPSSTYNIKEIFELKQASAHTSGSASSVWRASFDHPGTLDASVLGSSSVSHQSLYSAQTYSGNMSLRSDSSTTSTCSFAFPVLQSEWNGSPMRMARVDRQHMRSRRWWVPRINCCKF